LQASGSSASFTACSINATVKFDTPIWRARPWRLTLHNAPSVSRSGIWGFGQCSSSRSTWESASRERLCSAARSNSRQLGTHGAYNPGRWAQPERIRRAVAQRTFDVETSSEPIRATVSIGVASFPRDGVNPNELIHQADLAVYRAKLQGRNRVLDATTSEPLAIPQQRRARLTAVTEDGDHVVPLPPVDEMTPGLAEKLSIPAKPDEIVDKIKRDIEPAGVNHLVLCVTDAYLLKAFTGRDVDVPDVKEQLQLIHDEVMPAFA